MWLSPALPPFRPGARRLAQRPDAGRRLGLLFDGPVRDAVADAGPDGAHRIPFGALPDRRPRLAERLPERAVAVRVCASRRGAGELEMVIADRRSGGEDASSEYNKNLMMS